MREHNEDYLGHAAPDTAARARSHGWLFVLADGVGGHQDGEVASRLAVGTLLAGFRAGRGRRTARAAAAAPGAGRQRNCARCGLASSAGGRSMATTVVACALRFDRATVAHVGDSRCYLIRRGHARPLTRDHTLANEQFRMGILSASEAAEVSTRHMLSRSLGSDLFVSAEVSEHQVIPGDVLLLCSDGLHGAVSAADLAEAAGTDADLHRAAERLVKLANERDGSDNVSLQLIRVRSVERIGMYRGRPYKLP